MIWFEGKFPYFPRDTSLERQFSQSNSGAKPKGEDARIGYKVDDSRRIRRKPKGDMLIRTDIGVHGVKH